MRSTSVISAYAQQQQVQSTTAASFSKVKRSVFFAKILINSNTESTAIQQISATSAFKHSDHYQYLGDCPPTPPLTQH